VALLQCAAFEMYGCSAVFDASQVLLRKIKYPGPHLQLCGWRPGVKWPAWAGQGSPTVNTPAARLLTADSTEASICAAASTNAQHGRLRVHTCGPELALPGTPSERTAATRLAIGTREHEIKRSGGLRAHRLRCTPCSRQLPTGRKGPARPRASHPRPESCCAACVSAVVCADQVGCAEPARVRAWEELSLAGRMVAGLARAGRRAGHRCTQSPAQLLRKRHPGARRAARTALQGPAGFECGLG
jgi:hypothetical protein